jgi:hypothetical protein
LTGTVLWIGLTIGVLGLVPLEGWQSPVLSGQPADRLDPRREPAAPRLGFFSPGASRADGVLGRAQERLAELTTRTALDRLRVRAWHARGYRGKGVKIAILDSGFHGYRQALGKALPQRIAVRSFRSDGNLEARDSQHGILCAEVIHAIAPEAELLFANWEPERPEKFLEAVHWARSQGASIISCSIIMPTWSDGEGHGPVHDALRRELGMGNRKGEGLFFASAGNTALRHWSGPLRLLPSGWHAWAQDRIDNPLHPFGTDRVSVELSAPLAGASLEIVVRDNDHDLIRGRSAPARTPGCAIVRFDPRVGHEYTVRVRALGGGEPLPRSFHLTVLAGRLGYTTRDGSIPFPGDGTEVITVGAVDARGRRVSYSSCGPNSDKPKPDLVAPVPFPSLWRPHQAFAGTSAAAPQAAGLAALLWSRHPGWTAEQVGTALRNAARRLVPAGHSWETGYGQVRLP